MTSMSRPARLASELLVRAGRCRNHPPYQELVTSPPCHAAGPHPSSETRSQVRGVIPKGASPRSEEHTSELQSRQYLVCRLLLEKKNPVTSSTRPSSQTAGS